LPESVTRSPTWKPSTDEEPPAASGISGATRLSASGTALAHAEETVQGSFDAQPSTRSVATS
jgi:hypothetical protein